MMRRRLAPHAADDGGSVLVLVVMIALLLITSVAVASTTAVADLSFSSESSSSSQAALAAQSGLAAALAAMRQVSAFSDLPCGLSGSLSAPGATSSYSVVVEYSNNATPLACNGSTLGGTVAPTKATLISTGTAPHAWQTVMHEDLAIATSTQYSEALGYAIFTENNLSLTNAATLDGTGADTPNVYLGQALTCNNGTLSEGSVITYKPVTLSNDCTIDGDLVTSGEATLENSATVGGDLTSYGGGLVMSGSASVMGNATETDGNMALSNSAQIKQNAAASGSISLSGAAKIGGTQLVGDSSLSSQTMPVAVSWPTIDPSVATWQSSGWNVIQVPTSSCSSYFYSYSSGAADPFMTAIATATEPTVIDAPTCAVDFENAHTFELNANIVLDVETLTLQNSNTFESTTSAVEDFTVLASPGAACSTSTLDVSFANATDFTSTVDAFIYTPGEVDYANDPSMTGQILACGGMTGENAFTLSFNPTAAEEIPGVSTPLPPTLTVEDKYVSTGQ